MSRSVASDEERLSDMITDVRESRTGGKGVGSGGAVRANSEKGAPRAGRMLITPPIKNEGHNNGFLPFCR